MNELINEFEGVLSALQAGKTAADIKSTALQRTKATMYLALKNRGDKLSDKGVEAMLSTMPDITAMEDELSALTAGNRELFDRRDVLMLRIQYG